MAFCHSSRNSSFAGFPGHPPRPAPIGTGIGTWQSEMGRVQAFFKNPNQVRGGVRCSYNLTRPAPNMKLQLCPPLINISFLSSFQVFFSQFSFLSTLGFFLPLNAKIHQIIHSKIHQIFASSYSPYLWPTIPGFCGAIWTISLLGFISRNTLFRRHRGIIGGWCMSFQIWGCLRKKGMGCSSRSMRWR